MPTTPLKTHTNAKGDFINQDDIPALYATENVDFDHKIIYQRYHFANPIQRKGMLYDSKGFNWLLAELDRKDNTAYGWACLNDEQNAEWGYVWLPEIIDLGATRDKNWIPLAFPEAKRLCYGYLEPIGTKEHFDWWRYTYHDKLNSEHERLWGKNSGFDLLKFAEKIYKFQCGMGGD